MSPEMINFFSYCIQKNVFLKLTEGYPHDRCRRTMRKTKKPTLQRKPMELGGVPI